MSSGAVDETGIPPAIASDLRQPFERARQAFMIDAAPHSELSSEQIVLEHLCRSDHGEHFLLLDRVR